VGYRDDEHSSREERSDGAVFHDMFLKKNPVWAKRTGRTGTCQ
jgi:hypothetical protein